jgi:hypothetical protein
MKLKLDITPDLMAIVQAEIAVGEKAVTAAIREAGTGLKTEPRRVCRRLQLLSRMEHHERDHEQVFR